MEDSKNIFTPENKSISEIFNSDKIYRIPNFQRPYSWKNEQLDELWDDLYSAYQNKQNMYFLGSIVVVDNIGEAYQDLIDGQQRITTLMILFNVLLRNFSNINSNVEKNPSKNIVTKKTLDNRIHNDNGYARLQLQSYKDYDSTFKNTIIECKDFSKNDEVSLKNLNGNDPKYRYLNTANKFYEKLKKLEEQELGEFINFIFYNVYMIKIVCNNQSFAIKLFQVLNDRGMNLSNSDIIKANLIEKLSEKKDKEAIKTFESDWKQIENIMISNDLKMDDFFIFYEYYKLRSNPKKQVTDEIEDLMKKEDVSYIIDEMRSFSDKVNEIYSSNSKYIYSLRYLPWKFYINTILATILQVNYPEKSYLIKKIRRFYYLCFIAGKTLNGIKQTSFNIIAGIANNQSKEEIEQLMEDYMNKNNIKEIVLENLNSEYVYGQKWLKPVLMSLDYELNDIQYFIQIDKTINIDHILPLEYKKDKDWEYIDDSKAEKLINSLGNMAILSEVKNKSALNKGFKIKINLYQGLKEKGEEYSENEKQKGFTNFSTTRRIINEYNMKEIGKAKNPKFHKLWDTDLIMSRKEDFLLPKIKTMLEI